jgi:hypothetical protein
VAISTLSLYKLKQLNVSKLCKYTQILIFIFYIMDLVINNTNYSIPTTWSQVSLGKYMDYMLDIEGVEDELAQTIITISAFTDAPKQVLQDCKKSDIDAVMSELGKLMEQETNKHLNLIITIDNIDYGFHPNLHELKLKEFVDLDNKLADGWSAMDSVMAILYRPITEQKGDKYKIEEYDFRSAKKRAEIFRNNLSVNTVNGAASFFLTIATDYISTMQVYSKNLSRRERRKLLKQKKNNLTKNMAGIV